MNRDIPPQPVEVEDTVGLYPELPSISIEEIGISEVTDAIKKLQSGEAGGIDNIVPDLFKADIETATEKFHDIITDIWYQDKFLLSGSSN